MPPKRFIAVQGPDVANHRFDKNNPCLEPVLS